MSSGWIVVDVGDTWRDRNSGIGPVLEQPQLCRLTLGNWGRFSYGANAFVRLVCQLFRLKTGLRVKLHLEAYPRFRLHPLRVDSLVLVGCPGVAPFDLDEPGSFESFQVLAHAPGVSGLAVGK